MTGAGVAIQPQRQAQAGKWSPLNLALGLLILCFVWRVQDLFPILAKLRVPLFASFFGFGYFFVDHGIRRLKPLWRHPVIKWSLVILFVMAAGVPFALYNGLVVRFIINDHLRTIALLLVMAACMHRFKDVERMMIVHLVGAAAFAFLTITRYQVGMDGRLGDLGYYDANDLGMLMVGAMPMAIYFLRAGSGVKLIYRLFGLAALGLFVLTVMKTGSRGAFLGLIGIAIYITLRFKSIKSGVRWGAVFAGFLVLNIVGGEKYWAMMSTLLNPKADYNWSASEGGEQTGRMEVWKRGFGYMKEHPLTGVGARNFSIAEGTISPQAAMQAYGVGFKWSEAHNSFVQVGAELGFIGLFAFILQLGNAFSSLRKVQKRAVGPPSEVASARALAQALTGSLIGYVVAGFFLSQGYAAFLYVLLGMIVALHKVTVPPAQARRRRSSAVAVPPRPAPLAAPARA